MSDEELFTRIKQGDGDALSVLYDRYALRVARIARRWIHDQQGIEEVVQDVFTRIWTTTAFSGEKGQFGHWIAIVSRRITIDYLRKSGRNQSNTETDWVNSIPDENRIDRELSTHWLREDLMKCIEKLRPNDRVVIKLAYFEGYTLSEIASMLNIPIGTVKTRLHHGLKKLKSTLNDWSWEA